MTIPQILKVVRMFLKNFDNNDVEALRMLETVKMLADACGGRLEDAIEVIKDMEE
jgi:hypothetical protein